MGFQIHEIVFRLFNLPREVFVSCFLPIFVNRYFFNAPLFLENHSIVSHHVYTNVAGITQRVTLSAESHFKVFWVSFWDMLLYFLRTASHLVLWNFVFCTDVLCITLVVKVLRKISHHVSSFGHYETYFGYIPQCRKTFSWYSYACLDFTVVFTQLINVLRLPLVWAFWGVFVLFCTMFL